MQGYGLPSIDCRARVVSSGICEGKQYSALTIVEHGASEKSRQSFAEECHGLRREMHQRRAPMGHAISSHWDH